MIGMRYSKLVTTWVSPPGRDDLVDRDVLSYANRGRLTVDDDVLGALGPVGVHDADAGLAGDEGNRADAIEIEAADILLAADVLTGEGGRHFSAVAGQPGTEQVIGKDVAMPTGRRMEILEVEGRLDRVDVAAEEARRKLGREEDALAVGRIERMVLRVVAIGRDDLLVRMPVKELGPLTPSKLMYEKYVAAPVLLVMMVELSKP